MKHAGDDEGSVKKLLNETRTIIIIGCSPKEHRTSYHIAKYLKQAGYRIVPVNPNAGTDILGEKTYHSLHDLPDLPEPVIMNIFRNKRYTADMVREIADWSVRTGQKPVVWTQLDVSSSEAEKIADENELPYIKNRCIHAEHTHLTENG